MSEHSDGHGHATHSIIGPIAVNKAEPGDVLEIRYQRIRPYEWGAVFNNPGSLGTGPAEGMRRGRSSISTWISVR
jgi:acetamidase/formamidase